MSSQDLTRILKCNKCKAKWTKRWQKPGELINLNNKIDNHNLKVDKLNIKIKDHFLLKWLEINNNHVIKTDLTKECKTKDNQLHIMSQLETLELLIKTKELQFLLKHTRWNSLQADDKLLQINNKVLKRHYLRISPIQIRSNLIINKR